MKTQKQIDINCRFTSHDNQRLKFICIEEDCKNKDYRLGCSDCFLEQHFNHNKITDTLFLQSLEGHKKNQKQLLQQLIKEKQTNELKSQLKKQNHEIFEELQNHIYEEVNQFKQDILQQIHQRIQEIQYNIQITQQESPASKLAQLSQVNTQEYLEGFLTLVIQEKQHNTLTNYIESFFSMKNQVQYKTQKIQKKFNESIKSALQNIPNQIEPELGTQNQSAKIEDTNTGPNEGIIDVNEHPENYLEKKTKEIVNINSKRNSLGRQISSRFQYLQKTKFTNLDKGQKNTIQDKMNIYF